MRTDRLNVLVLINPHAGSGLDASLELVLEKHFSHYPHFHYEIFIPESIENLKQELSKRLSQHRIHKVVVAGGDGTLMEALPVLVSHADVEVGLIPLGTGNLLAKNLHIPLNVEGAIQVILTGKALPIDLARIENRLFALNAGIGLDAEIIDKTAYTAKKKWGILAYVLQGALLLSRSVRQSRIRIQADEQIIRARGLGVMVSNAGGDIGGGFCLTPEADATDGLLHGSIFQMRSFKDVLSGLFQLLSGKKGERRDVIQHFKARKIHIESSPPLKAQADGNLIGETPVTIEMIPQKLHLLVPYASIQKEG